MVFTPWWRLREQPVQFHSRRLRQPEQQQGQQRE